MGKKENPFKKLESNKEVPVELKQMVMESVESAKLLAEFGDLFSNKFGHTLTSILGKKNNKDNKKE